MIRLILLITWTCWMVACSPSGKSFSSDSEALTEERINYAQGFSVTHFANYTQVEVRDPWDTTRLLQRYLLIDRSQTKPEGLPKGTVVRVPIKNVVVYTSVHASIIDQLGETDKIVGVCEPRYIDTPSIQEGIAKGTIADLGEATSPNVEKMIEIGAELVIASPFQNGSYGPVEKIGIPIIEGADYMESLPLGRTEWIKFYGLLFGQTQRADSLFAATEQSYLRLCDLAKQATERPVVFPDKRYGSSWYMPAGDSYMAHLFADAGADYVFRNLPGTGSTPLAYERVFDEAIHADIWLIKYNQPTDLTYAELKAEYAPYANLDAFKQRHIYGCNTGRVPYYEEFPLHPDYLLKEFIALFHPSLLPGYTFRYYEPMKDE